MKNKKSEGVPRVGKLTATWRTSPCVTHGASAGACVAAQTLRCLSPWVPALGKGAGDCQVTVKQAPPSPIQGGVRRLVTSKIIYFSTKANRYGHEKICLQKKRRFQKNNSLTISSDASRSLEACFQFPPPLGVGRGLESPAAEGKPAVKHEHYYHHHHQLVKSEAHFLGRSVTLLRPESSGMSHLSRINLFLKRAHQTKHMDDLSYNKGGDSDQSCQMTHF